MDELTQPDRIASSSHLRSARQSANRYAVVVVVVRRYSLQMQTFFAVVVVVVVRFFFCVYMQDEKEAMLNHRGPVRN